MNWGALGAIPVVWDELPGPLTAGLGFRVGRADEPLSRSGLTHLVEHLALHGLGERLYQYDGWVNGTTTWFGFRGSAEELVDFYAHVQGNLLDLPLDRIETELSVLRAEEARQPMTVAGRSLLYRFGTIGWGTLDLFQYGINDVTPDQVLEWTRHWFGAGNAVMWTSAAPPDGLTTSLPEIPHRPEPVAVPLEARRWPAWVSHPEPVTALSFLAPRSSETAAATAILQSRLRRLLRETAGTSYEVNVGIEPLDAATSHVLVLADGPAPAVLDALHRVTAELAADGPSDDELEYQRAVARRGLNDPASVAVRLAETAHARLCRWPDPSPSALDSTTPADVAQLVASASASALYLVPHGARVPQAVASPLAVSSPEPVEGRVHRRRGRRDSHHRLIVGPAGVSEVTGECRLTVRAGEATAVLAWRNGARMLVGPDGTSVRVDPSRWEQVNLATMALDESLPDSVVVAMGDDPGWTPPEPSRREHPLAMSLVVFLAVVICLLAAIVSA